MLCPVTRSCRHVSFSILLTWLCCRFAAGSVVERAEDLQAALNVEEPNHVVLTQHITLLEHEAVLPGVSWLEFLPALKSFTVCVYAALGLTNSILCPRSCKG